MSTYSDPALILPASVSALSLADGAVTTGKIASSAVTTDKITDSNITTGKIASSAVTTIKIADSNITTAKIADSNVTTDKIASSAVTTIKIADSNITTAKIADSNVTTDKIANSAVTTVKILNGSITQSLVDSTLKRDTANGVAALDNLGNCVVVGRSLKLNKDASNQIAFIERSTGEEFITCNRVGPNDYLITVLVNGAHYPLMPRNEVNFGSSIGSGTPFTIPNGFWSLHRFIVQVRWSCTNDTTNLYFHIARNGAKISGTYGMEVDQYVRNIDTPIEFYAASGDIISVVASGTGAINSVTFYA